MYVLVSVIVFAFFGGRPGLRLTIPSIDALDVSLSVSSTFLRLPLVSGSGLVVGGVGEGSRGILNTGTTSAVVHSYSFPCADDVDAVGALFASVGATVRALGDTVGAFGATVGAFGVAVEAFGATAWLVCGAFSVFAGAFDGVLFRDADAGAVAFVIPAYDAPCLARLRLLCMHPIPVCSGIRQYRQYGFCPL